MQKIQRIQSFEHLKILADGRRLSILRILMAQPATLSQLGMKLGLHPAQVRHHLKLLENVGLVELVETRLVRGFVEKYYQARASAFMLNELILPRVDGREVIAVLGSHDLALEALSKKLMENKTAGFQLLLLPIGSLDGLVALRQGAAQLAGCHLVDHDSGEYNLPYIRRIFPDIAVRMVTMAHRSQGLMLPHGNPKNIKGLSDLARDDVIFVNRNAGSGTRLWLDRQLEKLSIPGESINRYSPEMWTHTAVAQAVHEGRADAGLGIQAAALAAGLEFVPLSEERYDLVLTEEGILNRRLAPLFDYLVSSDFRREADALGGYDTSHSGQSIVP